MALSSKQPRWDIYETVILLEGYLETLQGIQSKSQIIKRISADLRRMAVNRGVEIDDVYRNENGISYQIQSMDSAFKGQKVYVPATKLFTDAVTLYRTDNDGYQKFLWEAKGMIAVKQNNREAFLIWAKSAFSAQRCKWLEENILKMERFAVAARMISGSIFDVTDTAKLEAVYRASCKNKFFQIRHRKFIKNINEDFKEYIKYCSLKPDIREPASDSKAPTVSPETARSNVKIGSFVVNFDAEESMAYTKPTSVSLFGKELLRPSVWKDVYVCVIAALFEKHPDIFNSMHSFPGSKRIEFAKPQDADRMLSPKLVSDSLCVETNFSATDFIKRLKTLLTMCEESYDSLKITYEKRLYTAAIDKPAADMPLTSTSETTFYSYLQDIRSAERYAAERNYTSCSLFSEDNEITLATASELYKDSDFIRYNEQQHNRFTAAINKLLESIGVDIPQKAVASLGSDNKETADSAEADSKLVAVLKQHYKYGFKYDSVAL